MSTTFPDLNVQIPSFTFDISKYNLDGTLRAQPYSGGVNYSQFTFDPPNTQTTNYNVGGSSGAGSDFTPPTPPKPDGTFAGMDAMSKAAFVGGAAKIAMGLFGRKARRREQTAARKEYRAARSRYEALDTSNLAANIQNPFAENVYEDLTVNQQAAQFQAQQAAQSRANILQQLRGSAGGSGIAGLAQALANQASVAAQQAAASIAQQESVNERLRAQGELQVQKGEMLTEQQRLAGAERSRALESRKTSTLFGMAQQRRAAADQAVAQANAALYSGIGQLGTSLLTGGIV
tara:strand:+ start:713 stop:1585 length:873 start_codon:yes stop_codon:yes gene_type:complete